MMSENRLATPTEIQDVRCCRRVSYGMGFVVSMIRQKDPLVARNQTTILFKTVMHWHIGEMTSLI